MTDEQVVVLSQPRSAGFWPVLGGVGFVALGIWMVSVGEWFGWPAIVFFGGGLPSLVARVFRPDQMVISDQGVERRTFSVRSLSYRSKRGLEQWRDLSPFRVGMGGRRGPMVSYALRDLARPAKPGDEPSYRSYMGIPNYGMNAEALADLLNQRRRAALGEAAPPKGARSPKPVDAQLTGHFTAHSQTATPLWLDFPRPTGAPPVSGSFLPVATTTRSINQVAKAFGRAPSTGTVDGKPSKGFVVLATSDAIPVAFIPRRIGCFIAVATGNDYAAAYDVASAAVRGRIRRLR